MKIVIFMMIVFLCRIVQHTANKKASIEINTAAETVAFNAVMQCSAAIVALVIILISGNGFKINGITILLSAFTGSAIVASISLAVFIMKTGSMALTSMFQAAGLLVPCVAGIFLFNTPIAGMQWLGMVIFLISAYLMITSSKTTVSGFSVKTFALLVCAMLTEGSTMLFQQMFAHYVPDGDVTVYSFLSFGIGGLIMLAVLPFVRRREVKAADGKARAFSKLTIVCGAALGIAVLTINQIVTSIAADIPPVILFTLVNGMGIIVAAVVAAVMYKERLTLRNTIGIIIGIGSFIIIKAFGA